jgi:L-asparaginase
MASASTRPRIAVIFTGGTISMELDETGRAVPALSGAKILERTPGLDLISDVAAIDWGIAPASHLSFDQVLEIARTTQTALDRPDVAGAVIVQGTDTLDETAFAFDLLLESDKPVVVVGAMRSAGDPGYEGPANLRDAVRAAVSEDLVGEGVVVVMGGDIWPADDVIKTHSDRYDTFQAPNLGALGRISDGRAVVNRQRRVRRRLGGIPDRSASRVELITAALSTDGTLLRDLVRLGVEGIVVAATGSGNTGGDLLEAAKEAMAAGIIVVHTTRCPSGRVSATYGFPGGGGTWHAAGAIPAGFLGGPKARVALALGLASGLDEPSIRQLFAD